MTTPPPPPEPRETGPVSTRGTVREVFGAFLGLGLTSFGGPVAHLGYFHDAFVVRRRWLGEREYTDLVALCQFLPGPASSQVGMALGLRRAGYAGMAAAWVAFTLPSAALMAAFALGAQALAPDPGAGWLLGLKAAAVAVVAHALSGMAAKLATGVRRASVALGAMLLVLLLPSSLSQVAAIAAGAAAGLLLLREPSGLDGTGRADPEEEEAGTDAGSGGPAPGATPVRRRTAVGFLAAFAVLLAALPALAALFPSTALMLADGFYRAGALVFGGGHVVLPLLESEVVGSGAVDRESFLAGYGAAQAVPGPLFTFAAYLGALIPVAGSPLLGAAVALFAVFAPSTLLVAGALPFWDRLRADPRARAAVAGAGAAVVGILAAALYDPVFTEGVTSAATMAVAAAAFVALAVWRAPAWAVVVAAGAAGLLLL
ncbi:chromate efflux transporter [Nocardiopsis sp. RSe5-2]|uniref:Chromate efflux transporter n=1 Tax=Nocardiopsis endophytica TaxID=3018445 RepID=A0ABT4TYP7_9ACTN|nr:chromate efflux transporter [Nocardiopsis endophytica]MDA2809823.1 chromate efflux transporter [Nocardiopsis endophytica]